MSKTQQISGAQFEKLFKHARKRVSVQIGPAWSRLDEDKRDELAQAALTEAIALVGSLHKIDDKVLDQAAEVVRSQWRSAAEREVGFGEHIEQAPPAPFLRDELEERSEAAQEESRHETIYDALSALKRGSQADRARAAIIGLHLGESTIPGQPNSLQRRVLYRFPGRKEAEHVGSANRDLRAHHPGGGQKCPTCRTISRFVRMPELGPEEVSRVVDTFLVELRQRTR